ncbi:MAG: YfiT family bacillithiol transferase [Gemmatimonadaceae bacterium]
MIAQLRACPEAMRAAVAGLGETQLDTRYRDGGWTVRQVVHHLVDSHVNAYLRFKWTVAEEHPTIKTYDQDAWAEMSDSKLPVEPSLAILDGLHERWAVFLSQLPASAWSRGLVHPERGEMTLDDLLVMYAGHGINHVRQITHLRESRGW